MHHQIFVVNEPKFNELFWFKAGGNAVGHLVFRFCIDLSVPHADIRAQSGKGSEIGPNSACFCPPPFLRQVGQTPKFFDWDYKIEHTSRISRRSAERRRRLAKKETARSNTKPSRTISLVPGGLISLTIKLRFVVRDLSTVGTKNSPRCNRLVVGLRVSFESRMQRTQF